MDTGHCPHGTAGIVAISVSDSEQRQFERNFCWRMKYAGRGEPQLWGGYTCMADLRFVMLPGHPTRGEVFSHSH